MTDELIESGIPWIGKYPRDRWRIDRLKDVVVLRGEKTDEKSEVEDYVELEDVQKATGKLLGIRNTLEVEGKVTKFYKGDVLFGKLRPYLEKYYYADFDGKCTGEILVFKPERVTGKYLHYCIASPKFIDLCNSMTSGVKMPRIDWTTQLAYIPFPLPPKPEQEAIARYLDKVTAQIDAAIDIKQRQVEKLERYFNERVREVMKVGIDGSYETTDSGVEHLGRVPAHWQITQLKHAVEFLNHKRVPLSSADRGEMLEKVYDYYGASGVIDQVEDFIFDEPLLLIAEDGANLLSRSSTLAFIATGQYWVNNHAHIMKPRTGDLRFWAYMLESYDYAIYVTGAAQPKLNLTNLGKIKVAVPKPSEQIAIADYLDSLEVRLKGLQKTVNKQIAVLRAYRRSVIHEYVTGKKRVMATDAKNEENS